MSNNKTTQLKVRTIAGDINLYPITDTRRVYHNGERLSDIINANYTNYFVNVNHINNLDSSSFVSKVAARNAVPVFNRMPGLVITYRTVDSSLWVVEEFKGLDSPNIHAWNTDDEYWNYITGSSGAIDIAIVGTGNAIVDASVIDDVLVLYKGDVGGIGDVSIVGTGNAIVDASVIDNIFTLYKTGNFKTIQSPVYSPIADGSTLEFIDSITQNENGVITATKKEIREADAYNAGIVSTGNQAFAGDKWFIGNIHEYGNIEADGGVAAYGIVDLALSDGGGGTGTVTGISLDGSLYEPLDGIITLPNYPTVESLEADGLASKIWVTNNFADKSYESKVTYIESLIPFAASTSNKLADIAFVNSSVQTATADYQGSYSLDELGLTTSATRQQIATALKNKIVGENNNDYAFVEITGSTYSQFDGYSEFTSVDDYVGYYVLVGDTYTYVTDSNKSSLSITPGTTIAYINNPERVERYKYSDASALWAYEYTLNNSGFTAKQWASINSEITKELTDKIPTAIQGVKVNSVLLVPDSSMYVDVHMPTELRELNEDSSHRVVTDVEKDAWNSKYDKPSTGIPKSDLDASVLESLEKADNAIQGITVNGNSITPTSDRIINITDVASAAALLDLINGLSNSGQGAGNNSLPVYIDSSARAVPIDSLSVPGNIESTNGGVAAYGIVDLALSGGGGIGDVTSIKFGNAPIIDAVNGLLLVPVNSGTNRGEVNIGGQDVSVNGLGDLAFLSGISFDDLIAHPNTIAGYQIEDAYISGDTIKLGNNTITPITDVSDKADVSTTVTNVAWDSSNAKFTKTINGVTTDIVSATILKTGLELDRVGNFLAVSTDASQGLDSTQKSNARDNIGLDKVGNFLAVSTEANQNLNTTQKENARANIGMSEWTGSSNITTLGTVTSGSIPWNIIRDVSVATRNSLGVVKIGDKINVDANGKISGTWRGIQDNLTSDSSVDSLSARQGKRLDASISTLFGYFDASGNANNANKFAGKELNYFATASALTGLVNKLTDSGQGVGNHSLPIYINANANAVVIDSLSVPGNIESTNGGVAAYGIADLALHNSGSGSVTSIQFGDAPVIESVNGLLSVSVGAGTNNGQINIGGKDVSVNGLGTAAYTDSSDYAAVGHTHSTTISTTTGTSEISLGYGTIYSINAGGTSFKFTTPSLGTSSSTACAGNDSRLSNSRTPIAHADSSTKFGIATQSLYGHVKLVTGDMSGQSDTNGVACGKGHTHSQYDVSISWDTTNKKLAWTKGGVSQTSISILYATDASTAGVASKLGTTTVGSKTKPIFLSNGVPTASDASVGSTDTPVYLNAGVITSCGKSFSSYLPLSGGTMTGTIRRYYGSASENPIISLSSNNQDVWLWEINHNSSAETGISYGYGLKYLGTGAGNDNELALYADNQGSTQIKAIGIKQDGTISLATTPNVNGTNVSLVGHTHDTSIVSTSSDANINLAFGTKYKISTGGTSTIFSLPANPNTDAKVKQEVVTASGYSNWRTIPFGYSNSATEGFDPSTITNQLYVVKNLEFQPSTGTLRTGIFKSIAAQGTAPLVVDSSTLVTKLNADLLDGHHYTDMVTSITWHSSTRSLMQSKGGGADTSIVSFGEASEYNVSDSASAGAISSESNKLTTERDVYYGLPTINNSHSYTSNTKIYAPTTGGTKGYVLIGNGTTSAPVWNGDLFVDSTNHRIGINTNVPSCRLSVDGSIGVTLDVHAHRNIQADGGVAAYGIVDLNLTGGGYSNVVTQINLGSTSYLPSSGIVTLPMVNASNTNGFMSYSDKYKLDNIATGATNVSASTVEGWGYKKGFVYTTATLGSGGAISVNINVNPTYQYIINTSQSTATITVNSSSADSGTFGVHRYVTIYNNRNAALTVYFHDTRSYGCVGPANNCTVPANSFVEFSFIEPSSTSKCFINWSAPLKSMSTT